ncbi:hypothetical protein TNCV_4903981 [Trichonephila clavipes]|nr:hypothetical protein TNCV_4903981 [Trichonephila clavipes]
MYVLEGLQPEVVLFLQDIPGAIFQQDVAKFVRNFFSSQHMQLLPWPALKKERLLCLQALWYKQALLQADVQNLFGSLPRRMTALTPTRGGYTKY